MYIVRVLGPIEVLWSERGLEWALGSVRVKGKQPKAWVDPGDEKEDQWLLDPEGDTKVTLAMKLQG